MGIRGKGRRDIELELEISQRIRHYRKQIGLSQEELGNLCDLTRVSITNIEQTTQGINLPTLYRIATALGISVYYLLPQNQSELQSSENDLTLTIENQKLKKKLLDVLELAECIVEESRITNK
jgi:transcriptional regulator with XRE-family HTH domain